MAGRRFSGGGFGGSGGPTPDQERLLMYDRAVAAQERPEQLAEKLDFQRQKEAFAESQRQKEFDQRGSEANQRATQAENLNVLNQRKFESLQIERDSKQSVAEAAQALKDTQLQHIKEAADHATNFFKTVQGLDRNAPDFPSKVFQALADNPVAHDTPKVMDMAKYLIETHDAQQSFKAKAAAANPAALLQNSATAGSPVFGTLASDGKTLKPTDRNATPDATHVGIPFVDPKTGRVGQNVLPIDQYENILGAKNPTPAVGAAVGAVGLTAPPATPVAAPAPVAPAAAPTAPIVAPTGSAVPPVDSEPPAAPAAPDIHEQARQALQNGAPRDAVMSRLQQLGGDPSKL